MNDARPDAEGNPWIEIVVDPVGPLRLRGSVELRRKDDSLIGVTNEASLCRCGRSRTKPYCDRTHRSIGWHVEPVPGRADDTDPRDRPCVVVRANGPLVVEGRVVVRTTDGTELARGARVVLCRCGQSGTRPFCDGTHKRVGFTTE